MPAHIRRSGDSIADEHLCGRKDRPRDTPRPSRQQSHHRRPLLASRMIMKRPRAPRRDSRRRRRPPSRPRRPRITPRTVRLRLCRPTLSCRPCSTAARTPFSITLHTPCRQSQRRHRLSTRENAAKLRLPHALDFPPAADYGNHRDARGDIVMTQVVSIRLKASWSLSAAAPSCDREDQIIAQQH